MDTFITVVIGHFVGDYLLQSKKMALSKSEKGFGGVVWCTVHTIVYTAVITLLSGRHDLVFVVAVVLSHYPIDRWSLASWWLKFIQGRDIKAAIKSKDKYREADIAFSCLVYAVVDNTWHLLILWLVVKYL